MRLQRSSVSVTSPRPCSPLCVARAVVHAQEIVQTVITNVPGPQVPLYVCGRRMLEAYPYVPIAGHVRISVAIWSYCGRLYLGITGDWQGAPDIGRLVRGVDLAFEDLLKEVAGAAGMSDSGPDRSNRQADRP